MCFGRKTMQLEGSAMLETLRPDPTFYPSPKLAMEAPAENYAYVHAQQG